MACFLDCPHAVGDCVAALRTATAVRRIRDLSEREKRVAQLAREDAMEQRRVLAAVRSIGRFLRWPSRSEKKAA